MRWLRWDVQLRVDAARPKDLRSRLSAYGGVMLAVLAILLARLWVLQLLRGEDYAQKAQENHLKQREIGAPRGGIYDADGHRIAEVRASFDLVVSPSDVDLLVKRDRPTLARTLTGAAGAPSAVPAPLAAPPSPADWAMLTKTDIATLAARIAPLLDETRPEQLLERWDSARRMDPWRPVILEADLSPAELDRVLARRAWLPGATVVSRNRRSYPDGPLFAHLIGYLREVRQDDLETLREKYRGTEEGEDWYGPGDLIGKYGIEQAWEPWLRGRDGAYWVQVDVHGRELGRSTGPDLPGDEYYRSIAHFLDRAFIPEAPGHDLHLSLRRDLQQIAFDLLGEDSGAVVMLEVHTGRVLALLSKPGFDPEIFAHPITPDVWRALSDDPAHPLVDKALQGIYPPGSTWKMLVAAAVLGTGTWSPETRVSCGGGLQVGNRRFACWRKQGHGSVNLEEAIQGSCDVYFYRAGLAAGIDNVARYAGMFGMGAASGIGINNESSALNPSSEWKKKRFHGQPGAQAFTAGDTASAVIGQGYTLATPMQLARMAATWANGGTLYRPMLVDRVEGPGGEVTFRAEPEPMGQVDLAPELFEAIRHGMYRVVEFPGGTAHRQRLPQLAVAGKTGTAQVVRLGASTAKQYRDHAWFVSFAPYRDAEVAVAVLVENGEHGSSAAAPIARQLFEHYFKDRIDDAKNRGIRIGDPLSAGSDTAAGTGTGAALAPSSHGAAPELGGLLAVPGAQPSDLGLLDE
jgi:penicillin-binding protein 2